MPPKRSLPRWVSMPRRRTRSPSAPVRRGPAPPLLPRQGRLLAVGHRFAERIRERNAHAMSLESLDAPLPELFDRIIGTHASFVNDTPSFALVEAVIHRRFGGCLVQEGLDEAIIDQVRHFLGVAPAVHESAERTAATRLSVVAVGVTCWSGRGRSRQRRARSCCASCATCWCATSSHSTASLAAALTRRLPRRLPRNDAPPNGPPGA